jgi:hypothetical protein
MVNHFNMETDVRTFYVSNPLTSVIEDVAKKIPSVKAPQDTAIRIVEPTDALNPANAIIEEILGAMGKEGTMNRTVTAYKKITLEEMREPIKNWEIYNMLKSEISILIDKVDSLERNITPLLLNVASPPTPEIVLVEEMSKETAKEKVLSYIREHKETDIEELHKNIGCCIEVLVEVVDELLREGKIGED